MKGIKYFVIAAVLLVTSCKKKDLDMTVLNKSLFEGTDLTEIIVDDGWNVTVIQSDDNSGLELEYSAFLEPYLDVQLGDNSVSMKFNQNLVLPANTVINATVRVHSLKTVVLNSGVDMTIQGDFPEESKDIVLSLKGASTLKGGSFHGILYLDVYEASKVADLTAEGDYLFLDIQDGSIVKGVFTAHENIHVEAEYSRLITYGGTAKMANVYLENSCSLNMLQTPAMQMELAINADCEASVNVVDNLWGFAGHGSTVYYRGNPTLGFSCDNTSFIYPITNP